MHGLPEVLVSDNGSCFTSTEFQEFIQKNRIRHIRTAPYHPASNGQVERAVKIVKDGLKRATKQSLDRELSKFLFRYRLTPHSTTGVAPAELLLGRRPRCCLDFVKPDLSQQVQRKQLTQIAKEGGRSNKHFEVGAQILAKNFSSGRFWLKGTILRASGPRSYQIELTDGRIIRRHINHIRKSITSSQPVTANDAGDWTDLAPNISRPSAGDVQPQPAPVAPPEVPEAAPQHEGPVPHPVRRSNRPTQGIPPDYLRY